MKTRLLGAAARIAASLAAGGAAYVAWLSAFLVLTPLTAPWVETVLWFLAPIMAAAGFAAGMVMAERWTHAAYRPRHRLILFPLAGTVLGAAIVYSFGPMLIVFGMFACAAAAMGLLEILRYCQKPPTKSG